MDTFQLIIALAVIYLLGQAAKKEEQAKLKPPKRMPYQLQRRTIQPETKIPAGKLYR